MTGFESVPVSLGMKVRARMSHNLQNPYALTLTPPVNGCGKLALSLFVE